MAKFRFDVASRFSREGPVLVIWRILKAGQAKFSVYHMPPQKSVYMF